MGAEPTPQQRPEPLQRVDVHLAEPVAVIIPGELTGGMTDGLVSITPSRQPGVDVVLVGVNHRARGDRPLDQRADGLLFDVRQHPDGDLPAPLDHPEDRRLLLGQRAPTRGALQPASAAESPFFLTAAGWPLCPATT